VTSLKQLLGSGPDTAGQRNFNRWQAALNVPGFGEPYNEWAPMFEAETGALLSWTLARLRWLDAAFAAQALPSAGPDAYLSAAFVVPEHQQESASGPYTEGLTGRPAASGR
jgi:hypothetical protein